MASSFWKRWLNQPNNAQSSSRHGATATQQTNDPERGNAGRAGGADGGGGGDAVHAGRPCGRPGGSCRGRKYDQRHGHGRVIDEYTPSGTFVQQIALPTTSITGGNQSFVLGNGTSEGELNLSTDGLDLLLAGYQEATVGTLPAGGASTTKIENTLGTGTSPTLRVIGEVGASGSINTATALTNFASGGDPRGVVGSNSAGFWLAGQDATSGVGYISTLGSSTTSMTDLTTSVTNARDVEIFNGQLYFGQDKVTAGNAPVIEALDTSTTGSLQTSSTGTTINPLPGTSGTTLEASVSSSAKTTGFFFAKIGTSADFTINGADSGYNTVYVADEGTSASARPRALRSIRGMGPALSPTGPLAAPQIALKE